ncbi:hypothetical protein HMPREF3038_02451 [Akkermansia sp. KLE1797]|nr:hypothetical protein HMPREF3038_02451 [Akkermansia sp. KLE1797]KXU54815.1 hypothetical protein HMPREF3039_00962 [Akkermansia sp. KLE1798]KZA06203.1 hypothetical protein HMPREF1326_00051 [Akkermansia sp. KLE1605]
MAAVMGPVRRQFEKLRIRCPGLLVIRLDGRGKNGGIDDIQPEAAGRGFRPEDGPVEFRARRYAEVFRTGSKDPPAGIVQVVPARGKEDAALVEFKMETFLCGDRIVQPEAEVCGEVLFPPDFSGGKSIGQRGAGMRPFPFK